MSQKNIKIKIGDRIYPLTVSDSEEKTVTVSAENIAENIKKLKLQYKINDSQDLLAMSCLEFATKLQNSENKVVTQKKEYNPMLDSLISKLNNALS